MVSLLVAAAGSLFAVPLAGRIHEGAKFTNRNHRILPGKCCELLDSVALGQSFYFVADAYYACATVAQRLRISGSPLISRLRRSAVAYVPAAVPRGGRENGGRRKSEDAIHITGAALSSVLSRRTLDRADCGKSYARAGAENLQAGSAGVPVIYCDVAITVDSFGSQTSLWVHSRKRSTALLECPRRHAWVFSRHPGYGCAFR